MGRYILRFRGRGAKPLEDVRRIAEMPGVAIVDQTSRMLLVEMPEGTVQHLEAELPGWVASPEEMVGLPDPRFRIGG